MAIERVLFGNMPDGREVYKYIITNNNECSVHILTLGATLQSLFVKDKNDELKDVLMGFEKVEDYLEKSDYQGAAVGPFCNRIGGASMDIGGKHYELTANENGVTCLHSGGEFSFALWKAIVTDADSVEFSYVSPDGTNGFPGETTAKITYKFGDDDALEIRYEAVSTRDTYINLTNHAYFNLDGFDAGSILGHTVKINADCITAVDKDSIPTGVLMPVEGTPFDFREGKTIGRDLEADCEQLKLTGGYDHNFCIKDYDGKLKNCLEAKAENSGIVMNVYTDLPAVQFYIGNFLKGIPGKNEVPMEKRGAFCAETQFYPDTPHYESFPSCFYKAGEEYRSLTVFEFDAEKAE